MLINLLHPPAMKIVNKFRFCAEFRWTAEPVLAMTCNVVRSYHQNLVGIRSRVYIALFSDEDQIYGVCLLVPSFSFTFSESPVLDPTTSILLRAVLDEVCQEVSLSEIGLRAHVASKLIEAATNGETTAEGLRQVALDALRSKPTMWR
ncbi:hypothetical protein ML401_39110 (plasmid) [Bradyrhizobium sp. 62B]|nr:hypothetical protein ML401_39110 [Bradyrhizobium sp. 62B]